jgi:hypothetical protein
LAERVDAVLDGQGVRHAVPGLSGKNWWQHAAGAQMDPGGQPVFVAGSQTAQGELKRSQQKAVPSGAVMQ